MSMTSRSYDQFCGIARALDLVGERWALLIVRDLVLGPKRFTDLRRGLPGIGTNVLAARLKELERDGVVAFRGVDAQRILKEEFEIDCSLSSTYRLLHRLKLSWLAPRPRHPGADATAQAAFSQRLDCN